MIKQTTNYDKFRILDRNRRIYPAHIRELTRSIKEDNRLSENPIIVNENFDVIDGQHRLTVAKELGLPVFYIVSNGADMETVMRLQTQKNWTAKDYIKSYVEKGNEHYQILNSFILEYGLPLTVSMNLLSGDKYTYTGGGITKMMKAGKFQVSTLKKAVEFADQYKEIYQKIKKPFARTRDFVLAIKLLMKCPEYSNNQLVGKLCHYAGKLKVAPSYLEYARDLETIYNLKTRGKEYVRLF